MLLSCVGPSFPGHRIKSHDHQLYHAPIAALAGVRHVLCTARGEDPRAPRVVLQAPCTPSSFEHTTLAHEAFLRGTRNIDSVRSIHTRPANKTHISDITRCSARQHKACPERTSSGTIRWSFARTPGNLRSTPRRDTVPCPNRGHSRWPEAICPRLDRTIQ